MSGLADSRDRHKGRRCYIFGSGPSLNRFDCDKMALDGVTICVNASIMALKSCDYFMFCDLGISKEPMYYPTIFDKAKTVVLGNQDVYNKCIRGSKYENTGNFFVPSPERRSMLEKNFRFPEEGDRLIAGGGVVVATHLAYIFGCSPIILVGVDLEWGPKRKFFYDRTDASLWSTIPNEKHKKSDPALKEQLIHWTHIKAQNDDLPIFIANAKSRLCTLYPSIDLPEFLKLDG